MPGRRHRWEFMLMPGDDPATITTPASIYAMLKPWSIDPEASQIERAVVYTFHSALATQWRRGRLLLAGDAAHQMPPFLGQGMGSGLRDVVNLGWKLRDVILENAPEDLLDSYETERREHVRAYIELAVKLGGVIQTTDPEAARQRDRELLANPTMLRPLAPRLGPGLHGDAPEPAGTRAAQPRLRDGRRLDDVAGYHFAVLARDDLADQLSGRPPRDGMTPAVLRASGEAADYLAQIGAAAIVVRPDRHILGVANTPEELDDVLSLVPSPPHRNPAAPPHISIPLAS
jgi:3-(3-hydroxy-phenyl)propionate hydroxylase